VKEKIKREQFPRAFPGLAFLLRRGSSMKKIFSSLVRVSVVFLMVVFMAPLLMEQTKGSGKVVSSDYWTWQNPLPTGNALYGLWGSSSTDVFAVGQHGTILHYDGSSWSGMQSGTTNYLAGVSGNSASNVYAVGEAGTILHYDGSGWSLTSIGANGLAAVWCSPSTPDVFIVGGNGAILHFDGTS
jgi:hypothetical protein